MTIMRRFLFLACLIFPTIAAAQLPEWHKVAAPTGNSPHIYGSYAAGCMDGGIKLPASGAGYVQGDVHDNRAYAQPKMITYIIKLGEEVNNIDRTLIIGDLSSPRGGPAPISSSLHQSHQTGLDVDIWLRSARKSENPYKIKQVSMLDKSWNNINKKYWGNVEAEILARAASFAEVDRIFINPVIKKELCRKYAGEEWMQKIRAWWGHAAHFHVRLKCPKNSPDCVPQKPISAGDGCGVELAWWFSDEAKLGTTKSVPRQNPALPQQCKAVYEWENAVK